MQKVTKEFLEQNEYILILEEIIPATFQWQDNAQNLPEDP